MNLTMNERHQASRLTDYRDQISSALFHMHRILTTYFPDENNNIKCVIDMQNILDNHLGPMIQEISLNNKRN